MAFIFGIGVRGLAQEMGRFRSAGFIVFCFGDIHLISR